MNKNQKLILVAVLAVIVGMLAYPPFQIVNNNGVVFNMGYGWIVDPPKRGYIKATVNVAMLLIQWIGVLVVGGLAFLLAKSVQRESDASSSNSQNESHSTVQLPPAYSSYLEANAQRNPDEFYKAIVGPKNQDYYLRHFSRFDSNGKVGVSWHWPACFVPIYWSLYRKMWLNALLFCLRPLLVLIPLKIVAVVAGGSEGTVLGIAYAVCLVAIFLFPPMYANGLYYKHCKKKISEARASSSDFQRQIGEISAKGGTSRGLIFVLVFVSLVSIGILAAIAIPQFQDYKDRARLAGTETSAGYQQSSESQYYSDDESKRKAGIKYNEFGSGYGKISVFTEYGYGTTNVYVDGVFIGQLNNYFPAGTSGPACGQDGTVSKILEAGSHQFRAQSSDGTYWESTIYISEGECSSKRLQTTQAKTAQEFNPAPKNEYKKKNGKLSIYTEYKNGTTDVYIDGEFTGRLNSHFPAGSAAPECEEEGTINKTLTPGSHQLYAKNSDGSAWEFTVNIKEGLCHTFRLSKQ